MLIHEYTKLKIKIVDNLFFMRLIVTSLIAAIILMMIILLEKNSLCFENNATNNHLIKPKSYTFIGFGIAHSNIIHLCIWH